MAKLVGTFFHSHGGTTSMPGEEWRRRRLERPIREDMPIEDDESNIKKAARTHEGFRVLREKIAELKTDVLIVFSDDQLECFDFNNYPAFAVYVGEEFKKSPRVRQDREDSPGMGRAGRHAEPGYVFKNHKELAVATLCGVMKRGFDPAFCMDMPKPDRGLAGGVIRTLEELTEWNLPAVPIMMNLYFAPQPTAYRCYQFGKAVREVINEFPEDLRVGVVGSGGLWHTPGRKNAWLNVDFDHKTLELLEKGDARGMAEHLDSYEIPEDDESQDVSVPGRGITGMPQPGGPSFGTRETCAWIAAAAVTEGQPHTIVDYIDAWASPVGNAFAYCEA
jgi:3-O-methylgallate 3,4-dioxygenase